MGMGIHKTGSQGRINVSPMGLGRAWLSLVALRKEQEVTKYTKLGKQVSEELWKAETRKLQGKLYRGEGVCCEQTVVEGDLGKFVYTNWKGAMLETWCWFSSPDSYGYSHVFRSLLLFLNKFCYSLWGNHTKLHPTLLNTELLDPEDFSSFSQGLGFFLLTAGAQS